jgi:hypothetical protein
MILAVILTVLALGAVWVYAVPLAQNAVPASWQTNRFAQIAITGAFLLLTVAIVGFVLKRVARPIASV